MAPRLALLLVSLLWGISFVFTKPYLTVVNPLVFTAYNFLVAGIFFALLQIASGKGFRFRLREGVILGVFLFFLEAPQMIGLSQTTAANTAFITSVGILLIPLLERLLYGFHIRISTWIALAVSFYGLYLLTGGIARFNEGDLWVGISAVGALCYMVFSERYEKERSHSLYALCGQQFLVTGVLSLGLALFFRFPLGLTQASASWTPLVILTIIFTLIPYVLLQWAEEYASPVEITFYSILEPLIGGIAAWTIGAEYATPAMMFGGVLIVLSLVISEYRRLDMPVFRRRIFRRMKRQLRSV